MQIVLSDHMKSEILTFQDIIIHWTIKRPEPALYTKNL